MNDKHFEIKEMFGAAADSSNGHARLSLLDINHRLEIKGYIV